MKWFSRLRAGVCGVRGLPFSSFILKILIFFTYYGRFKGRGSSFILPPPPQQQGLNPEPKYLTGFPLTLKEFHWNISSSGKGLTEFSFHLRKNRVEFSEFQYFLNCTSCIQIGKFVWTSFAAYPEVMNLSGWSTVHSVCLPPIFTITNNSMGLAIDILKILYRYVWTQLNHV